MKHSDSAADALATARAEYPDWRIWQAHGTTYATGPNTASAPQQTTAWASSPDQIGAAIDYVVKWQRAARPAA